MLAKVIITLTLSLISHIFIQAQITIAESASIFQSLIRDIQQK